MSEYSQQSASGGEVREIGPGVRCIVAPNGGMMTGPGTNTYLLGHRSVGVIDPGPADDGHINRILEAVNGHIDWIMATHTHRDHSPGVAPLAARSGARVVGLAGPVDSWNDATFAPDLRPQDGELIETDEWCVEAIHTPGHASNHICYLHTMQHLLFTGDHIMNGTTVVIAPPDGDMTAYLKSLNKIRTDNVHRIAPGHGAPMDSAHAAIDWIVDHRLKREAMVLQAVTQAESSPAALDDLVKVVYRGLDPRLVSMAKRSLEAHLLKLQSDGNVASVGRNWRLAR